MEGLGEVPPNAGRSGVLRVLASYPATPDDETLEQCIDADQGKHPGATLNMTSKIWKELAKEHINALEQQVIQVTERKAAERRKRQAKDEDASKDEIHSDDAMVE